MNKEFVPHQESLELKELGFDEACFGYYNNKGDLTFNTNNNPVSKDWVWYGNELLPTDMVLAPIYQQAFRWFREKYELHSYIQSDYSWNISGGIWDLNGYKDSRYDWDSESFKTYEEAELECLKKLIEIVKQQK